jgi:hypothetical protein
MRPDATTSSLEISSWGRGHEPAVAAGAVSAGEQAPAGRPGLRGRVGDPAHGLLGDDRPDHCGLVGRVAHGQVPDGRDQGRGGRAGVADHDGPAGGGALLAGVAHGRPGHDGRRPLRVGVGQHDRGVEAAHLGLGGDAPLGGGHRDPVADGH